MIGGNYRYGEVDSRRLPVESATVIEVGDIVCVSSGNAIPAADVAWDTDLATTQEAAHDVFAGVALQRSKAGETNPITIATRGGFEFPIAAATFAAGDLFGSAKQAGNAIESQTAIKVAAANLAYGRARSAGSSATSVVVDIVSTLFHGGPQASE
ncbi:hypothetical protein GYB59_02065 [bacterium]|nr:hypothetical protein [bacterium]